MHFDQHWELQPNGFHYFAPAIGTKDGRFHGWCFNFRIPQDFRYSWLSDDGVGSVANRVFGTEQPNQGPHTPLRPTQSAILQKSSANDGPLEFIEISWAPRSEYGLRSIVDDQIRRGSLTDLAPPNSPGFMGTQIHLGENAGVRLSHEWDSAWVDGSGWVPIIRGLGIQGSELKVPYFSFGVTEHATAAIDLILVSSSFELLAEIGSSWIWN
ncbi:hypothetical protein J2X11_001669 [Aeromicrobium panaciterrae]|uniref:Uncharacterized protein n=1 Tax=Aeromicrobium panaciterrae TaxID=363861 RepID=A0ABU1UNU5_9ACTN|nr:hypothetical protein [Aeromicrobium panaciterrae]MDR7086830.1 hypothetical protein [Aeromicrobium panaciterrae]